MVRGLLLIPADGPLSWGGGFPDFSDDAGDNDDKTTGASDASPSRERADRSVADIMAACEALEKHADRVKNGGEDSEADEAAEETTQAAAESSDESGNTAEEAAPTGTGMRFAIDDAETEPVHTYGELPDQFPEAAQPDDCAVLDDAGADNQNEESTDAAADVDPHTTTSNESAEERDAVSATSDSGSNDENAIPAEEEDSDASPEAAVGKGGRIKTQEEAMKDKSDKNGNLRIQFDGPEQRARLKVIGVGGAGSNAVNNMITSQLSGVDFISVNTDAQALYHEESLAPTKVQIGKDLTRGLGAGGDPEMGRLSAEEDLDRLREIFNGADMVFVAAGMGGGTGSGAAPVIAQLARDRGILTIGIVTKPFMFEGRRRSKRADEAIAEMKEAVDTLIVIPNDKVFDLLKNGDMPYQQAFREVDDILYQGTKGISDVINTRGFINVDFADAKSVMSNSGDAIMGIGVAEGEGRATAAAEEAITSPLLEDLTIEGAKGILINITGGKQVGMREVQEAVNVVTARAQEEADIYFGLVEDESMGDKISVTVIATGFNAPNPMPRPKTVTKVEPQIRFHTSGRTPKPLKSVESHDEANGNGTNGNGTNGNGTNGHDDNGYDEPRRFMRVDADPDIVDETLAEIDMSDPEIPAFLRRKRQFGK